MTEHVSKLRVVFNGAEVGTLATDARGAIYFQYERSWLQNGFDLAPELLKFDASAQPTRSNVFRGLHGLFNDSLPDGWGLLLMDRAMKERFGWDPAEISPLDRLAYIGNRGMGALEYHPATVSAPAEHDIELFSLAAASEKFLQDDDATVLADLYIQGGSPGGARPKVTVARNVNTGSCVSGFALLPSGYEHWIVKFRGKGDPSDACRIEQAYADMAREAQLTVPESELIAVKIGRKRDAFFATKRFDRSGDEKRHVLSLCGLLHADHRMPSLQYDAFLGATRVLTRNAQVLRRAFRVVAFNVLAHNKDDHSKNFAFLGAHSGWSLSPSFDLTFSSGMNNQHTCAVSGSGTPGLGELLRLATDFGIKDASAIIDEVRVATSRWPSFAERWGVCRKQTLAIQKAIGDIDKRFVGKPGAQSGQR